MSNNLRTRNGMPFNFVNGLKVRGMDIESLIPGIEGIPEAGSKYQFAGNGSNKAFTLPVTPYNKDAIDVYVKQLYVHPDDYTLVGDTVTLTEAPPAVVAGETYNVVIKVSLTTLNGYVNANRVSFEGENLDDILEKGKPLANYSALRAYAGAATQVRITDPGVAGFFYWDPADTSSVDNGGTVIVGNNGKRWKRNYSGAVNVRWFGAKGDGVTDDTVAISMAITATPIAGALSFDRGTYRGYLLVWRDDIVLVGAGSASTKIKLPDNCPPVTVPWEGGGNVTGLPNVLEIGKCALGNAAPEYKNVAVKGMTLDGNYTNNTAPVLDLFGHGMILTKVSNYVIDDVVAENCYVTGIDCVINSNYGKVNARVANCGNASIGGAHYPNFDVNSSKFSQFQVVSSGGKYGGRMLDNCWGNTINMVAYSPNITGFLYGNQSVNTSYANIINVTVVDGCNSGQGMSVGDNCYASDVTLDVRNATGIGFYVAGSTDAFEPRGNRFNVNTFGCGGSSVRAGGKHNQYNINSRLDGRTGEAGSCFAVDIYGSYNQFTVNLEDSSTPQVRGIVLRAEAQSNNIVDYKHNETVQNFLEQGVSNTNIWYFQHASGSTNRWQLASLSSGWNNTYGSPYAAVEFVKDSNGFVHVKGTVTGGSGVIFTFPAGFRPTDVLIFPTFAEGTLDRLVVNPAGEVTCVTGTVSIDLSPIRFATF